MARQRTVKHSPKRGRLKRSQIRHAVEAVVHRRTEKEHYVVSNPEGGWDVIRGSALRALRHFNTKKEAVEYGQKVSRNQKTEFVIHRESCLSEASRAQPAPTRGCQRSAGSSRDSEIPPTEE